MFITSTSPIRRWSVSLIVSINWAVTKTLLIIYAYSLYVCIYIYIYGVRLPSYTGIILSNYKDSYEPTSIIEGLPGFCVLSSALTCWTLNSHQRNVDFLLISKWRSDILSGRRDSHPKTPIQSRGFAGRVENLWFDGKHLPQHWSVGPQSVHLTTLLRFWKAL